MSSGPCSSVAWLKTDHLFSFCRERILLLHKVFEESLCNGQNMDPIIIADMFRRQWCTGKYFLLQDCWTCEYPVLYPFSTLADIHWCICICSIEKERFFCIVFFSMLHTHAYTVLPTGFLSTGTTALCLLKAFCEVPLYLTTSIPHLSLFTL